MLPILLAIGISYTLHAKDVFQPPKPATAEEWSTKVSGRLSVAFKTAEGTTLRGWVYRSTRSDAPYVLFFYGSNEDLVHEAKRLAWLRDNFHVNALCFDYPGYGFSGGSVTVESINSSALQEFDYVKHELASNTALPVFSYGWSIGASLAIHVAAEREVAGLILQAPAASAKAMTAWSSKHDVPWFGRGIVTIKADPAVQQLYRGATAIREINCPLLVIQGELDDVVPIAQGRQVFEASPSMEKQFVEVPGAHHNDLRFDQPPASIAIGRFLEKVATQ